MATENPPCMQVGNACRYADANGVVHDALITELVNTFNGVINLSYNDGADEASNVLHSNRPTANCWGCAEEGAPQSWGVPSACLDGAHDHGMQQHACTSKL